MHYEDASDRNLLWTLRAEAENCFFIGSIAGEITTVFASDKIAFKVVAGPIKWVAELDPLSA